MSYPKKILLLLPRGTMAINYATKMQAQEYVA